MGRCSGQAVPRVASKDFIGQHDDLSQEIQAKIAERQELNFSEFERDLRSCEISSAA